MITNKNFLSLRERAEAVLHMRKNKIPPDYDIYQLVEELNLYHLELEIQNEDLINTQLELQASHNKYADLYNLAPIAYVTCNDDGLIVDINQAGLALLGLSKHTLINRCFSRHIVPEDQVLFSQHRLRSLNESISQTCELKIVRWSGPSLDVQVDLKTIQDTNTNQKQFLICITDISARKLEELATRLRQVKMASIDRMQSMSEQIYSITDNQNHSLTVIDNYIYGCIRRLESEKFCVEELLSTLKKVSQQSRVLALIVQKMKNFVSKNIFRYETARIDTVINEILTLIHYESLDYPVAVHYDETEGIPAVKLDKLHIQQVLLHLARNSIEAMRDAKTRDPKLRIEVRLINNEILEISMFDNGPGLDQSIEDLIFEAHFTTKTYGVGLGLSVSRTIVEKHGGQLRAINNVSGGACFQLTLPCIAKA